MQSTVLSSRVLPWPSRYSDSYRFDVIARPPGSSPRYLERAALGLNFSPSSEIRERQ